MWTKVFSNFKHVLLLYCFIVKWPCSTLKKSLKFGGKMGNRCRLLEGQSKLFFGFWQPLSLFCVMMIPHGFSSYLYLWKDCEWYIYMGSSSLMMAYVFWCYIITMLSVVLSRSRCTISLWAIRLCQLGRHLTLIFPLLWPGRCALEHR